MANLKEVRTRIQSIKSTRQITSAMKMVSASKLHKSQSAVLPLKTFTRNFSMILHDTMRHLPLLQHAMIDERKEIRSILVIAITANKGLCGNYNELIIKRTHQHLADMIRQGYDVKLLIIGKKGEAFFRKQPYNLFAVNNDIVDHLTIPMVNVLGKQITDAFRSEMYDRVDVVYNSFVNAVTHSLTVEQIIPIQFPASFSGAAIYSENGSPDHHTEPSGLHAEPVKFIIEPSVSEVVDALIPAYFAHNLYRILLDASASEHGARMTAMHKATDNADDLLKSLSITYNKVRQAMITREIMEIVGGSED